MAKESRNPSTGQLADFFQAIDEAAAKQLNICAYCGSDEPFVSTCHFCAGEVAGLTNQPSPPVVHSAGEKLAVPPHIFIVDDCGKVRQHLTYQKDNRTVVQINGKEIEI